MDSTKGTNNNRPNDSWYRRLLESTQAISWEIDASNFRFTHISEQVVALLGYSVEQWCTENFWMDHVHPDDKDWASRLCMGATERNEDHELEYRFIAADGHIVWLREVAAVVENENGQRMLQGFMFDINDRKQVEETLHVLATSSPDDKADDFFFDCVKSLAQVYGAKFAFIGLLKEDQKSIRTLAVWAGDRIVSNFEYELEGTPCNDILCGKLELIPTGASQTYADDEMLIQMGVDSYFGSPLLISNNQTIGLVSVMDTEPMKLSEWTSPILGMFATRIGVELEKRTANQDLHDLNTSLEQHVQQRTAELEAANKELEQFAYSVSHDLRAPLRGISGFSQALAEDYDSQLDESAHNYLHRIQAGCGRMNDLIEALLSLSRLTRGTLRTEKTNLSQLAHEVIQQIQEQTPDRQIDINIEHGLHAHCDPKLLRAALTNLFDNAWKYTARNETPNINFRRSSDGGGFEISDNGVGFDMQYVDNLFNAFQRLHPSNEFEGSGIGLATVARIIQRHGGRVWATSEPNKGAVFGFSL